MPELKTPNYIQELNLNDEPFKNFGKGIDDQYALSLVRQTFAQAESWRNSNHDRRWDIHDKLYAAWVPPKKWDGTDTARSSLGRQVVFEQVETALPTIMTSLFPNEDWLGVYPEKGASMEEAQAKHDYFLYIFEHKDEYGIGTETEFQESIKGGMLYGNGFGVLEFNPKLGYPVFTNVNVRDIWIDPATPTPVIDHARYVLRRRLMTVDELESLRDTPYMSVPPKEVLMYLAQNRYNALNEQHKTAQEANRRIRYAPGFDDYLPMPSDRHIEVIVYYSSTRIIWVLNREVVVYNAPNPYGFIPFVSFPCYTFPGRFYAMSMGDVLEGTQLYIQALFNARLDELHLSIQPPMYAARASIMGSNFFKWKPGAVNMVDNPKDNVVVQFPQNAAASVSEEIQYLEMSAEKLTGVNGPMNGVFRGGNVNRTATGVNVQMQGASNRMYQIVRNIENYMLVPMLHKIDRMTQYHAEVGKLVPALGKDAQVYQVGSEVFYAPTKFSLSGASKMLSRDKLGQVLPFAMQYLLNGQLVGALGQMGKTVDYMEVFRMFTDAMGLSKAYTFIRDMTPEEQQARQQPPPEVQAQMQMKQQDGQIRMQAAKMSQEAQMHKNQLDYEAKIAETDEKSAREILKVILEQMNNGAEVEIAKQKAMIQKALGEQKLQINAATARQKLMQSSQEHQQKMQQGAQQTVMGLMQQDMQHKQAMRHGDDQMGQQLAHTEMSAQQSARHKEGEARQGAAQRDVEFSQKLEQNKQSHKVAMEQAKEKARMNALGAGKKKKPSKR